MVADWFGDFPDRPSLPPLLSTPLQAPCPFMRALIRSACLTSMAAARIAVRRLLDGGVRYVVVSPGSRSAPMAYALAEASAAGRVELLVRIDERSAGFTALGLALATGAPAAVLTTSGTAVGNLLPAVMEANHAAVPLVVLSADRPEELRGTGANQTTVQLDLFGEHVRFAVDVPAGEQPAARRRNGAGRRHRRLRGHAARARAAQPRLPRPAGSRRRGSSFPSSAATAPFRIGTEPLTMSLTPRRGRPAGAAHRGARGARRRSRRRGVRPRPRPAAAGRAVLQLPASARTPWARTGCCWSTSARTRRSRSSAWCCSAGPRCPGRCRRCWPGRTCRPPCTSRFRWPGTSPAGARETAAGQPGRARRVRRPGLRPPGSTPGCSPGAAAQHAVDGVLAG